ncbi:hypothetical protein [Rhizobium lentis]|uniref:Uncharacterized protein n=1 Tax=Rhizobium lentis TaxID=1138194 RepID=A0A9Q3QUC2_9HYPH|nr:hypothetical protein [Rhizobium lentis]MBX4954521.1 hypothetical protein [Rhizobium lentis]MBX4984529.1 hypothetical protein [Rhizobium lentis]MBX4996481.1 hypothetical protein [Rhizobium lentis]MBX5002492.1 hypothetical protein [Rhizobium lentis]MBX5009261.1 hypothetical protein [Rhizobium lentis]
MNALDAEGNIAASRQRSRNEQLCEAFPQLVIFLKHESGFGRLDERWGMSGSS